MNTFTRKAVTASLLAAGLTFTAPTSAHADEPCPPTTGTARPYCDPNPEPAGPEECKRWILEDRRYFTTIIDQRDQQLATAQFFLDRKNTRIEILRKRLDRLRARR